MTYAEKIAPRGSAARPGAPARGARARGARAEPPHRRARAARDGTCSACTRPRSRRDERRRGGSAYVERDGRLLLRCSDGALELRRCSRRAGARWTPAPSARSRPAGA